MPARTTTMTPGLTGFLRSLRSDPVESSIEHLISLLKRRQIHNSRPCAIATTQLLLRVVADFRGKDVDKLISRVRNVGQKLITAQPREMAVGNIVRRVLALIREVIEDDEGPEGSQMSESMSSLPAARPGLPSSISAFSPLKHSGAAQPIDSSGRQTDTASETSSVYRPPLMTSHTSHTTSSAPLATSLFGLFSVPDTPSPSSTPGFQTPRGGNEKTLPLHQLEGLTLADRPKTVRDDFKADVIDGIREILDELDQVDEQIAGYALDQIHSNEIVLTHSSSTTVQKFLLTAARKRKFTVLHVESFPNDHHNSRATMVTGQKSTAGEGDDDEADVDRFSPLTAAGITVVLVPDSAVFAIMSRVNKVVLATHSVLANGGLLAAAGAHAIAKAAKMHQTPVVVLSGVYKLSPVYALDVDELIEYGDPGKVVGYDDGEFVENVDVTNPLYDHVPPDLVDIYITNLGPHAPSYLYRIVQDHYRKEDITI